MKPDSSYSRYLPYRPTNPGLRVCAILFGALCAVVIYGGIGALFAHYL